MVKQLENQVKIIPFKENIQHHFKEINFEWINHYFKIIDHDKLVLENPKEEIIDKGGYIYFAEYNNEIVGCVALEKISDTIFELSKMGVKPNYHGFRIGKLLILKALEKAKQLRLDSLVLYTNPILKSAVKLYKRNGFQEVTNDQKLVKRATLKMKLELFN